MLVDTISSTHILKRIQFLNSANIMNTVIKGAITGNYRETGVNGLNL